MGVFEDAAEEFKKLPPGGKVAVGVGAVAVVGIFIWRSRQGTSSSSATPGGESGTFSVGTPTSAPAPAASSTSPSAAAATPATSPVAGAVAAIKTVVSNVTSAVPAVGSATPTTHSYTPAASPAALAPTRASGSIIRAVTGPLQLAAPKGNVPYPGSLGALGINTRPRATGSIIAAPQGYSIQPLPPPIVIGNSGYVASVSGAPVVRGFS